MNSLFNSARSKTERRLRERIFNALPAASFQMDRLLQLLDIVESDAIPTACVECTQQPRLLLNPKFIEESCATDESLFLLVMHELYHIILGHTRLFPRATRLHNLVFDAVINAMLCQQFPDPVYTRFFQELNPWDSFPARLLAPPPGWPDKPAAPPDTARDAEVFAIELLYGKQHEGTTYLDVFNALIDCLEPDRKQPGKGPILIGNHHEQALSGQEPDPSLMDPTLRSVIRKVVEGWPPPPVPIAGRDEGHSPNNYFLNTRQPVLSEFAQSLRKLLRRAGVLNPAGSGSPPSWKQVQTDREFSTVLPQLRDRRHIAWKQITGTPPVFYQAHAQDRRRRLQPREVAHAYLDVSGSMTQILPHLGSALDRPHQRGEIRLFAFSTVVDAFTQGKPLASQPIKNTYGTNINCVLQHLAALPRRQRPKRVLIFSDGYTGPPHHELINGLLDDGLALYVGLIGTHVSGELKPFAKHLENLPHP